MWSTRVEEAAEDAVFSDTVALTAVFSCNGYGRESGMPPLVLVDRRRESELDEGEVGCDCRWSRWAGLDADRGYISTHARVGQDCK